MLYYRLTNSTGLAILLFGFGVAFGIGWLAGFDDEGRLMLIAGLLVAVTDLLVRVFGVDGHWLYPNQGGKFLWLPIWMLGVIWLVLGAYDVLAA